MITMKYAKMKMVFMINEDLIHPIIQNNTIEKNLLLCNSHNSLMHKKFGYMHTKAIRFASLSSNMPINFHANSQIEW